MQPRAANAPSGVASLNGQVVAAVVVVQRIKQFVDGIYEQANALSKATSTPSSPSSPHAVPTTATDAVDVSTSSNDSPCEALSLAHDAATLVRAHATKIGLLIVNTPFTPSAITKVVQELLDQPVPALAQAVALCTGDRYTHRIQRDLALRCGRVLGQLQLLLEGIPTDGQVVPEAKRGGGDNSRDRKPRAGNNNGGGAVERGSFLQTGVLWSECDDVIAFAKLGVRGRFVQIVDQLADTLQDAMDELKEWDEEEDDEDDDEDDEDDDGEDGAVVEGAAEEPVDGADANQHAATQAVLDALMMGANRHIPADDPQGLRPRLAVALRKLRLVRLLCQAVVKRRLRPLPALPPAPHTSTTPSTTPPDVTVRLDRAVAILQRLPDRVGDLAAAFYALDAAAVDTALGACVDDACAAAAVLARPWDGDDTEETGDAFTAWVAKFQTELRA
ncbi:hypothetical protein SPI_02278 [Niveomyces insectorum RCEF 264]|uniref:Uncharacterized protein n=1 Tax=Niveomyces insectorum RCEF 264 TaxID=1081102 RepID=A0A167XWF6_9HYPO|nr:hypothetical protein SPI_02278 [Niveomyces insectorum RCEF 264]